MKRFPVSLTKEFHKSLKDLEKAGRREILRKAQAAATEAQLNGHIKNLERTHHGEDRLPDCEKFDLGSGYRLVVQLVDGKTKHRAFLYAGTHDDAESWLESHRDYRWVRRESDGTLEFIPVSSPEHLQPPLVPVTLDAPNHLADAPLLADLPASALSAACPNEATRTFAERVTREDWERDANGIIERIERDAGAELACLFCDLFQLAHAGDPDATRRRIETATGAATQPVPSEMSAAMLDPANSERILTWDESAEMPPIENWQEWMLFLHPEQRSVAAREYQGPARLRGVSGSGKTCVMIHRARLLSRKYDAPVAVLTLTESMRKLLDRMLRDLCGAELARIETHTLSAFAKDVLDRHHPKGNAWYRFPSPPEMESIRSGVVAHVLANPDVRASTIAHFPDKEAFLWEMVQYVRTRFPRTLYADFLDPSKSVRHSALTYPVRKAVVAACEELDNALQKKYLLDNEGLVQEAYELVERAAESKTILPGRYRAILVDEVQDCTQMEVRLLARLWTVDGEQIVKATDGLFLVGDGAQTVYKKGFVLSQLGIGIAGRSEVLKKNYRNSREILEAAYSLVSDYEYSDVDEESIRRPQLPDFASRRGERPQIVFCRSREDEADFVADSICELLNQGILPGQIGIIGVNRQHRDLCATALKRRTIQPVELREDADFDSPNVKITTIESAKGHDFMAVFVVGVNRGVIPKRDAEQDKVELAREASRLYVAMTRATHLLSLTCTSSQFDKPSVFLAEIGEFAQQLRRTPSGLTPIFQS